MHIAGMRDLEKPENIVSHAILAASLEVHRNLGPGLLEKTYEACLAHELSSRNIRFARPLPIPVT